MFFMAALAIMCTISCDRRELAAGRIEEENVLLNVSVPSLGTKAAGVTDDSETAVNSLQVFVFRKNGELDACSSERDGESLSLSTTSGLKDIVAVTNAPEITGVTSLAVLEEKVTDLKENAAGNLVMSGTREFDVRPDNASVEIDVTRRVARIYLTSVINDFTSEAYRNEEFRIEKIYLVNAAGSTGYMKDIQADLYYNKGMLAVDQTDVNFKAILQDEKVSAVVEYGEANAYTTPHYFYCYPNAGTVDTEKQDGGLKCTKLVIEATLAGKTTYYPVAIGNILANHKYNVQVRITRPGSEDPDIPVSFYDATVTVNVNPWDEGQNTDVTI